MNIVQFPVSPVSPVMTRRHSRAAVEIGVIIGLALGVPGGMLAYAILFTGWLG